MDIKTLKPGDEKLGMLVWWKSGIGDEVIPGKVKSWNATYIFVVFNCEHNWENWMDYTAEACNPQDLILYAIESPALKP